jgi:radical SAM superfamily enzyme YgiQ (UPF0313 family)
MNILLINPACPDTFWSYTYALRFIEKKATAPPLGLLTVAAMLPADWGKRLADLQVAALDPADLAWTDMVFITGMSIQRDAARQIIAQCKAAGKVVVAGGPLFTMEYAFYEQVDHFILNEAELTLPPFLADLAQGCAKRLYRTRAFADVRQTPAPMWELADLKRYAWAGVQYSRGCPFDCEFCNVTALLGRKPRTKTGAQVVAELDGLMRQGWQGPIFFVDDNLIGDRPAARKDLIPALYAWQKTQRRRVTFNTQVSINLTDDDALVRTMVQAGFGTVFVGIETPDPESLVECHKNQNQKRDLLADVKSLQNAGLEVQAGFILGFDNDKPAVFQKMVDFVQQSGVVTAMVGLLQSSPGTQLHNRLIVEGRLAGISTGDNADGTTNIVPRMGLQPLRQGYQYVLGQIYSPRLYYQRVRAFLREYRPDDRQPRLSAVHLRAFLRSVFKLGVLGRERVEYWKLLLWTLWCNPLLLPDAVRLAIIGHHYRRVYEDRVLTTMAVK